MTDFQNLKQEVISPGLCTCCGTCIGVCPTHTLSFKNNTVFDEKSACIHCGKCISSCPGKYFDYAKFEKQFQFPDSSKHLFVGHYQKIYAGHSQDQKVRALGSSGGCITELLLYLIRTKSVDAVITTINGPDGPTPIITAKESEIIQAAQSKYCISPTNIILKQVIESNKRFAYVGLPCQIEGLRKAMETTPVIKKRISIVIGLFCGFNMTMDATHFLVKKSKIPFYDIQELSYRKKLNETTGFYIRGSQRSFFIEKHGYTFLNLFFSPKRCLKCYDYAAEFADISFGDAWEQGLGWSRIICRTPETNQLIQNMANKGALTIQSSNVEAMTSSQKSILSHKKLDFWVRRNCYRKFPDYNTPVPHLSFKNKLHGIFMTVILFFAHSKLGLLFLNCLPFHAITKLSKKLRK